MPNPVPLNDAQHQNLKVLTGHSAAFGDAVNHVPVFTPEFAEVQREYPILFRKEEKGYSAVALLGFDRGENLFLDEKGWQARYVPAAQRRGPFMIGFAGGHGAAGEPVIYIDQDHPRISTQDGLPLFLPHGGNAPYLEASIRTLQILHNGAAQTASFFEALEAHGLLEPVEIDIELSETARCKVPGFHTVSTERLAALPGDALRTLNEKGMLLLVFAAVSSLGNIHHLIERKRRKEEGGAG
ncbi:SapC family protein [Parvularcula dongshanensis]|uniref:Peptide ABC transporter permease n=1 Tax=Parvularcula dongshanensis TaxID=1173995 RepID=A0A840I3M2_9PROT|nr:SapC family protein [Parvularcula dongshanensis]MBB4659459.1 hypothetical protein [Parvularcula dongshanensis]